MKKFILGHLRYLLLFLIIILAYFSVAMMSKYLMTKQELGQVRKNHYLCDKRVANCDKPKGLPKGICLPGGICT